MVEQQIVKERPKRSSYSDFIGEAEQLPRMKEGYELKLLGAGSFESESLRMEIINQARIMKSELDYINTEEEGALLSEITQEMEARDKAILKLGGYADSTGLDTSQFTSAETRIFKDYAYQFLSQWNRCREAHNLALQTTMDKGEIESIYRTDSTPQWFKNAYGVPISPQMEVFCRYLYVRSHTNWHNVVVVDGKFGVGKSSFVYAAFTTLEQMNGRLNTDLRTYQGLFFKEKRSHCKAVLKRLPSTAQPWYDEAGNQFGKSTHWQEDQIDLINEHALQRDSFFTNWLVWGDKNLIDSDVRNYVATSLISIKERGSAIMRQFNENPNASSRADMTNKKKKDKIVKTSNDAAMILENDALTRMIIPYYDPAYGIQNTVQLTDKNWKAYKERKQGAKATEASIFTPKSGQRADDFYREFLVGIDKEYVSVGNRINTEMLARYAQLVHQYLSMNQVASRISRACGTTVNKIFVRDNVNPNNGYIVMDSVIVAYLQRLRAEDEGAKGYTKETEKAA